MSLRIVKLIVLEDLVEVGVLGELQADHLAYLARRAGFVVWRKQPSVNGNPISYILLGTGKEDDSAVVMKFLEQHARIECNTGDTVSEALCDTGVFHRTPAQKPEEPAAAPKPARTTLPTRPRANPSTPTALPGLPGRGE